MWARNVEIGQGTTRTTRGLAEITRLGVAPGGRPESLMGLNGVGHIAEGAYTARAVARLAKERKVDMPITRAVCRVLDEPGSARAAVQELMAREQKPLY